MIHTCKGDVKPSVCVGVVSQELQSCHVTASRYRRRHNVTGEGAQNGRLGLQRVHKAVKMLHLINDSQFSGACTKLHKRLLMYFSSTFPPSFMERKSNCFSMLRSLKARLIRLSGLAMISHTQCILLPYS